MSVRGRLAWALLAVALAVGLSLPGGLQAAKLGPGERVTMDFQNVDLRQVILFVAEMTGKNYVVDSKLKGKVTVITPTPVTAAEAERIFESILSVQGFTVIERDGAYKIVPDQEGKAEGREVILKDGQPMQREETVVSRLVRVVHADSSALAAVLKPLMHSWGNISAHTPGDAIIVTDAAVTVEKIVTLIRAMDLPRELAEMRLFFLRNISAAQVEKLINSVFTDYNAQKRKGDPGVKLFADDHSNSVVAVAPRDQLEEIARLIHKVDRPAQVGSGNLHLYYPKNSKAETIAKVLNELISKAGGGGSKSDGGLKPLELTRAVNVVGEKETNTLVVAATPADYKVLLPIIEGLDMRRLQVHIEALIIEVTAERAADFGVEWRFTNVPTANSTSTNPFGGSTFTSMKEPGINNPAGLAGGGLAVGLMRGLWGGQPNLGSLLKALQNDSDVNVLATPNLVTMDGVESSIVVGENIPINTGTTTTSGGVITDNVERKDVGLTLKVTPRVIEEGWLELVVFQEQSSVVETSGGEGGTNFRTKKRSLQTTVNLQSDHMVVLGGLVREDHTDQVQQVPFLGDVPGIGELFKRTSRTKKKSNLMVFIKPVIINTYANLLKVSEEKYQTSRNLMERESRQGTRLLPSLKLGRLPRFLNPPTRRTGDRRLSRSLTLGGLATRRTPSEAAPTPEPEHRQKTYNPVSSRWE